MTDQNDPQQPWPDSEYAAEAPASAEGPPAGEQGDTPHPAADAEAAELTFEQLQQERDELEDRLKRVSADYQNAMRRAQQNVATAQQQQLMDVAKSLVTVLDHFDHALQVDPETTSPQKMIEGVEMVRDELLRVLHQHGVERVEAQTGDPFDPNRHEAMMRQPTHEISPDHVATQIQSGYALKDKTIRPVKVAVAHAPEAPEGETDASSQ